MGELNKKPFVIVKIIIIYLTFVCLFVSINFIIHIGNILNDSILTAIGGLCFLFLFISTFIIDLIFLIHKKHLKHVLLYNSIFTLISGFTIRFGGYLISNNLGSDFSFVYLNTENKNFFSFHYDLFNYIVIFQKLSIADPYKGIKINLIMLGFTIFLFYCYKKVRRIPSIS